MFYVPLRLPKDLTTLSFEEEMLAVFNTYKDDQIKKFNKSSFYVNAKGDYVEFIKNIEKVNLAEIPMGWALGNGFKYFRTFGETLHFDRLGKLVKTTKLNFNTNFNNNFNNNN